jgi:hypothetical protein
MNSENLLHAGLPRFTDRLQLGDGLQVSPFALGMVGTPGAICAAFDKGINFFFVSADMHWPLYEPLRQGLRDLLARGPHIRSQIVVGAVSYCTQPEFCSIPFQELAGEIPGLETIDLLIAGGAYGGELESRLPVYKEHRREGYLGARAIGVTFHDRRAAVRPVTEGLLDMAFIRYNPSHPGARRDLFPHVANRGPTLLFGFKSTNMTPRPNHPKYCLSSGNVDWRPKFTDCYRFALTRTGLDGLLIAPRTAAELSGIEAALERGPLDQEEESFFLDLCKLPDREP